MGTRFELGRHYQNKLFSSGRLFVLELPDEARIHETPYGSVGLRFEQDEENGYRYVRLDISKLPILQTRKERERVVNVSNSGDGRIILDRAKVLYVHTDAKPEQFRSVRKRR